MTTDNTARVSGTIKALEWHDGAEFCGQPMSYAETEFGLWMIVAYTGRDGRWTPCDPTGNDSDDDWATADEAKASAEDEHNARIAAAIQSDPEPRSMMVSALGRRAVAEGWAVEMYREVVHHGPPPFQDGGWKEKQLRKEADENEATAIRMRERVSAGQASARDLEWLAGRERDLAAILEMQAEKRQQHG